MSLSVLAALLALIVFGLITALINRGNIVLLMLLPASNFLGFIDPMKIAAKGIFDIHAFIFIINILLLVLSIRKVFQLISFPFNSAIIIFFLLTAYGILLPVFDGNSSLFYSIKSSKEFLCIFTCLPIYLFVRNKREIDAGWRYLILLGLYYCLLEVFAQFSGIWVKKILVYDLRPEASYFWKIYPPFWPVILIALFHSYYQSAFGLGKHHLKIVISLFGLLLTFFRSYLLASLLAMSVATIATRTKITNTIGRLIYLPVIILRNYIQYKGSVMQRHEYCFLESIESEY